MDACKCIHLTNAHGYAQKHTRGCGACVCVCVGGQEGCDHTPNSTLKSISAASNRGQALFAGGGRSA